VAAWSRRYRRVHSQAPGVEAKGQGTLVPKIEAIVIAEKTQGYRGVQVGVEGQEVPHQGPGRPPGPRHQGGAGSAEQARNPIWRPDRERAAGESRLKYLATAKDRDLIRWPYRRLVGFAIMTFGAAVAASGLVDVVR
jgi:hypothetical protein